jgi:hypothetical protein
LPYVGLEQPFAQTDYTYGYRFPITEAADFVAGAVWRASRGFWSTDPVVVSVNGVVRPSNQYILDRTEGTVTFTGSLPSSTDSVAVAYTATEPDEIAQATGIIAASLLSNRALVSRLPVMGSLRALRVAEVSIERGSARTGVQDTESIPVEAADLLEDFVFRTIA